MQLINDNSHGSQRRLGLKRGAAVFGTLLAVMLLTSCYSPPKHSRLVPGGVRQTAPSSGLVLVNFHCPQSFWSGEITMLIFDNGEIIGEVKGGTLLQSMLSPGKHQLVATFPSGLTASVVNATLLADKVYDLVVDRGIGWIDPRQNDAALGGWLAMFGDKLSLMPVSKSNKRHAKLIEEESESKLVELKDAKGDSFKNRSEIVAAMKSELLRKPPALELSENDHR